MQLEPIHQPIPKVKVIISDFGVFSLINAVIAFLFAASAPVAIILEVGVKGGLSEAEMSSWIFAAFVLNGILGIILSIIYRQPLVFFWTISGTVLVGPALEHLSFQEVIGAFYGTGVLLLILGVSGWVKKVMAILPMPIIMGMVAGVFMNFAISWIKSLTENPMIAVPMTLIFVILSLNSRLSKNFPPMIGVLIVGLISVHLFSGLEKLQLESPSIVIPKIFVPEWSMSAILELVVPLTITVLAAQNAQGIAVLRSREHNPPINSITTACGFMSLITAIFGSVSTCLTGPVNAILSSSGEKSRQYSSAIVICVLAIIFGLFSPFFTELMLKMPSAFIATLAGLALIRVLQTSFSISFSGRFTFGALISFLVTVADQPILGIGAPFWGLVFGFLIAWLLEKKDFLDS